MLNQFVAINGTEKIYLESVNKMQAMEDVKNMGVNAPVYPSISANVGNLYHLSAYIVKKACLRYSGDNRTLYNIGVNAKVYNNLLSSFIPSENVPSFDEYAERKFTELNHDTKDAVQAIVEKLYSLENKDIDSALKEGFKAINAHIYGEKTNGEKGTYNTLIQDKNGKIIDDKIPALKALAKAIRNNYFDNIDKIIAIIGTALNDDKTDSIDIDILRERIEGTSYRDIANEHGVTLSFVQESVRKTQNRVKKHGKKMFPEVFNTLRKIVRIEYRDENGDKAYYNTLERI